MTKSPVFCFDMDGTISNLYAVEGWLSDLRAFSPRPYMEAQPMMNFSALARQLNAAQRHGAKLMIISWSSKCSNEAFDAAVREAKLDWLDSHLPSVEWDAIHVVPYGTNKADVCGVTGENFILFDDEERNRDQWAELDGLAFNPSDIAAILRQFNRGA